MDGHWQEAYDGIWFLDLPQARAWEKDINRAEEYRQEPGEGWNFRQLFVDGKRAIRARYPNADQENPFLYASGGSLSHIELAPGQVREAWGSEEDAQINIVSNWRFFNQRNDVSEVDVPNSTISIGPRERHGEVIEGNWFWIEGVKSELDQSGEWYLDTRKGRLYFKPEEGQDPNNQEFIAPYLNRILFLKGDVENGTHVKYVNFKGLEFRHATYTLGHIEARVHTDGAVVFENASNCRIDNCHFENIGGYALWLHLDCKQNYFHQNTVLYPGGGGVLLTGSRLSYMDDSKVYTPGKAAEKVAPILNHIAGNYIGHNHFEDLSRNGIFVFCNQGGNVVEYNHIHDAMQTTIDGAAIHFATMNHLNAPNFILNNWSPQPLCCRLQRPGDAMQSPPGIEYHKLLMQRHPPLPNWDTGQSGSWSKPIPRIAQASEEQFQPV